MTKVYKACDQCGVEASPTVHISGHGKCRECAIANAVAVATVSFDLSARLAALGSVTEATT